MTRSISHSEASVLLDCQAKHDFAYVGQLAGSALKPITQHVRLREGKAWGRAMAAYHAGSSLNEAEAAIEESISEDMQQRLVLDPEEAIETSQKLHSLLEDYASVTEPIGINASEVELDVQIPSRSGKRASTRYRFGGYIDAIQTDPYGRDWIIEFKLRGQLSSLEQVALMRQTRWYAWAYQRQTGRKVAGVIVEERLNQVPKPARILANGLPSHTDKQATTPGLYAAACRDAGIRPSEDTLTLLAQRVWQARHTIFVSETEIAEAGRQLTSVASLTGQFDSGHLFPVRNPSQFRCPFCAYRDICNSPTDADLVDALYERTPAKKDRQEAIPA